MDVHRGWPAQGPRSPNPVITIGTFDGVHRGHQAVLQATRDRARVSRAPAWVLTFDPHPAQVLRPQVQLRLLTSIEHRLSRLAALGLDGCVVAPFTMALADVPAEQFIRDRLVGCLGIREICVGPGFRFGHHRVGDVAQLRAAGEATGFRVTVVDAVTSGGDAVSSTRVRRLVEAGELDRAADLLGGPVTISGRVVRGDGRGRVLGYPTANLADEGWIRPPAGVYAVEVCAQGRLHGGMMNVGQCPTFPVPGGAPAPLRTEVHLLDVREDLVGAMLDVVLVRRIRDEQRFADPAALQAQLQRDEQVTRACLSARRAHPSGVPPT